MARGAVDTRDCWAAGDGTVAVSGVHGRRALRASGLPPLAGFLESPRRPRALIPVAFTSTTSRGECPPGSPAASGAGGTLCRRARTVDRQERRLGVASGYLRHTIAARQKVRLDIPAPFGRLRAWFPPDALPLPDAHPPPRGGPPGVGGGCCVSGGWGHGARTHHRVAGSAGAVSDLGRHQQSDRGRRDPPRSAAGAARNRDGGSTRPPRPLEPRYGPPGPRVRCDPPAHHRAHVPLTRF